MSETYNRDSDQHKSRRLSEHISSESAKDSGLDASTEMPFVYSPAMLSAGRLEGRGGDPMRSAVMEKAQQTHGNHAVQRSLGAGNHSVERTVQRFSMPDLGSMGIGKPFMPDLGGLSMPDLGGISMPDLGGSGIGKPFMPDLGGLSMPDLGGIGMPDLGSMGIGAPFMPDLGGLGGLSMPDLGGIGMPDLGSMGIGAPFMPDLGDIF